MKKSIVVLMVVLATLAVAQPATAQQPAAGAQAGQPGQTPQQQKTIKDPAEYNAYMSALNQSDPNQKAIALEGFLQQYPNSVMKEDALELLMASYEQSGNPAKVQEAAQRILQANPNNLKALALLTYTNRAAAEQAQNPQQGQQALAQAAQYGQQGLQALTAAQKPEGMSDADWQKLKSQVSVIFNGSVGQNALAQKNYPAAQQALQAAVDANPTDLRNIYPLALSYLEPTPINTLGLWYIARAVSLTAQAPQQQQFIAKYGRAKYVKYHGGDDGWQELVQQAAQSPAPPQGFSIAPAPSPAEQAAKLLQEKQVKDMSFDEFQLIFTSGNQQAADQVWNEIKGKPIAFAAKVVSASAGKLTLSATAEDIEKNAPDVEVSMSGPLSKTLIPQAGSMTQVQAVPASFTANPFMITMTDGKLVGVKEAPAAAPKKSTTTPPARRKH